MAESYAPIAFANISFTDSVAIGTAWPISWTTGNSHEISLYVENTTSKYEIFAEQSVLPSTYVWTVGDPGQLEPGEYRLRLQQDDGEPDGTLSPEFVIILPDGATSSVDVADPTQTTSQRLYYTTEASNFTVTYTYWDSACGCHKTGSGSPVMTTEGGTYTTATWYESQCGCTTSGAVSPPSDQPGNNYTMPTAPRLGSISVPTRGTPTDGRGSPSSTSNFANQARPAKRLAGSFFGVMLVLSWLAFVP